MAAQSTTTAMLSRLRRALRADGWTIARLADELGVGTSTVKRWLTGKALTLDRLDQLAGVVGLSLPELARDSLAEQTGLARELTLAQERALSSDMLLAFLFYTIVRGAAVEETARDFRLPDTAIEAVLEKLERLALIDRTRSGRVRPLVDRRMHFKLPMHALFELHMKPQFMQIDFTDPATEFSSELVKLSSIGAAELAELVESYRYKVLELADSDRQRPALARSWYGTLCVMRRMDMSPLDGVAPAG